MSKRGFEQAFADAEAASHKKPRVSIYDLPSEMVLQLATAGGRIRPEVIAKLSQSSSYYRQLFEDPRTKRALCKEFRHQLGMLDDADNVVRYLRKNLAGSPKSKWGDVSYVARKENGVLSIDILRIYKNGKQLEFYPAVRYFNYDRNSDAVTVIKPEINAISIPSEYSEEFWEAVQAYYSDVGSPKVQLGTEVIQDEGGQAEMEAGIYGVGDQFMFQVARGKRRLLRGRKDPGIFELVPGNVKDNTASEHPYCRDVTLEEE